MNRTTLLIILGIVVVVGAAVWQPWLPRQPKEETRTAVVERGTLLVTVSASGRVEPEARVSLSFDTPDQVAEVLVKVGDAVQAGDPLARLDSAQLALQVQQARAALEAAQAQLALMEKGARPEEIAAVEAGLKASEAQVSVAAANLDQLVAGASDAQIAAADAQVAAAELQYKSAQVQYEWLEDSKDVSKKDQARRDLYVAEKALEAARAGLDAAQAGADADLVRAARANVLSAAAQQDAAQAQLDMALAGASKEQILGAEAQVSQARAALEMAELALERATLRAPFDGVVAAVNLTANEMASAGRVAIVLMDTSRFHITIDVDEIDVRQLVEGQAVQVMLDALPGVDIVGMIERIAPDAISQGGTVYYKVVVRLAPTDAPVRADMTADVTIAVEELTDVLHIPTWAVRIDRDTGQYYVHRQIGDGVEKVDVMLGVRHEGIAQVLDGLAEGEVVVWAADPGYFELP